MTIFSVLSDIASAIAAFLIIIGIHELGHFFAAKYLGVSVVRLSLGFGKPLWSRKSKQGTEYALSPILIGGYVKLLDEREMPVAETELDKSFSRQKAWKRFGILSAGPLTNFFIAICLFTLVLSVGYPISKPVIAEVIPDSLAQKAGFQVGDTVLAIQKKSTPNWIFINLQLLRYFGEKGELSFRVQHADGSKAHLHIALSQWKLSASNPDFLSGLGVKPSLEKKWIQIIKEKPWVALGDAWQYTGNYIQMNYLVLYKVFRGILSIRSFVGPVAIWEVSVNAFEKGWIDYCFFLGFLSIAIGFFNLLPVPGLDGFQMLILLIEKITRKPVSIAAQVLMYRFGLILLSLLFVQVLLNDLHRMLT